METILLWGSSWEKQVTKLYNNFFNFCLGGGHLLHIEFTNVKCMVDFKKLTRINFTHEKLIQRIFYSTS